MHIYFLAFEMELSRRGHRQVGNEILELENPITPRDVHDFQYKKAEEIPLSVVRVTSIYKFEQQ